jgi:hypothetical protein
LKPGDYVQVKTRNSTYLIQALDEEFYAISGGWVDRRGLSPLQTRISGCAFGGSTLKADIVVGCGLHLEFGGRLTTAIRAIKLVRSAGRHLIH